MQMENFELAERPQRLDGCHPVRKTGSSYGDDCSLWIDRIYACDIVMRGTLGESGSNSMSIQ